MSIAAIIWFASGLIWVVGSGFQFAAGNQWLGFMYVAIGAMNAAVGVMHFWG